MMALVAGSSLLIQSICTVRRFAVIHGLSVPTLLSLPFALHVARKHNVDEHARGMNLRFFGGSVIAGAFALLPGRIVHDVVFGTVGTQGSG